MKRPLLTALALTAVVGFAACSDSEQESDATPVQEATTPAAAPAPVTPDSTMIRDSVGDTLTTTTRI